MIIGELEGDWYGVGVALNQLPSLVRSSAVWGQRKAMELLVKTVKKHINNQDLNWEPRSARTNSNDPRILVDDGYYYGAIKVWKQGDTYIGGVKSNAVDNKGNRISDYAIMNEVGWEKLPARPLWAPSFEEMGGFKGFKSIVTKSIFNKVRILRSKGFEVDIGRL
jgi:hypothetical protein